MSLGLLVDSVPLLIREFNQLLATQQFANIRERERIDSQRKYIPDTLHNRYKGKVPALMIQLNRIRPRDSIGCASWKPTTYTHTKRVLDLRRNVDIPPDGDGMCRADTAALRPVTIHIDKGLLPSIEKFGTGLTIGRAVIQVEICIGTVAIAVFAILWGAFVFPVLVVEHGWGVDAVTGVSFT
jgi:hypothetical protein